MRWLEAIYYRLRDLTSRPDERGERSAGFLQDRIRRVVTRWSRDYRGRLIELGCGEGLLLAGIALGNPALEIVGIDRWPGILERGRELLDRKGLSRIRLAQADASRAPFPDTSFDVVLFVNAMICLKERSEVASVFKEIFRLCRPGGRCVIEFRNASNFLLRWKYRWARHYDATTTDHPLSTYRVSDVRKALTDSGFAVVREARVGFGAASILWEAVKR